VTSSSDTYQVLGHGNCCFCAVSSGLNTWHGLAAVALHVVHYILNTRYLREMASYDVTSNTCQALCPPRHPTDSEDSTLDLNGFI
jgi:hypothetical protein